MTGLLKKIGRARAATKFFPVLLAAVFLMVAGATHLSAHAGDNDDDGACVACQISAAAAVKVAPDGPPCAAPVCVGEKLQIIPAAIAVAHLPRNIRSRDPPALFRSA